MTLEATEYLMNRQPWDFLFTTFIGIDIMCHFMWKHMETLGASARSGDPALRETLANAIQTVYRQADTILAKLLAAAGEDTSVVVVSDHGFGPLDNYMHLNAWLVERGYVRFKRSPLVSLLYLAYRMGLTPLRILDLTRRLGFGRQVQKAAGKHIARLRSLAQRAFLSLADVDWSRTTAYAAGFGGPIFVNLRGRHPQGVVEPGAEYEALLQQMEEDLRALRHPVTHEPYVGEIYRPGDLYSGPYTELAPDLFFVPRDWRNQSYGVHDFASNRWLEPSPDRSGTHRMDGIMLWHGPGISHGTRLEEAAIWDVVPTILALMGEPIPESMDGQVLTEMLSEDGLSRLSVTYRQDRERDEGSPAAPALSETEEQAIRERLEALGYFG
jgi:predicted AlkP superfamily phosphohydrolase/phosphomutase